MNLTLLVSVLGSRLALNPSRSSVIIEYYKYIKGKKKYHIQGGNGQIVFYLNPNPTQPGMGLNLANLTRFEKNPDPLKLERVENLSGWSILPSLFKVGGSNSFL